MPRLLAVPLQRHPRRGNFTDWSPNMVRHSAAKAELIGIKIIVERQGVALEIRRQEASLSHQVVSNGKKRGRIKPTTDLAGKRRMGARHPSNGIDKQIAIVANELLFFCIAAMYSIGLGTSTLRCDSLTG